MVLSHPGDHARPLTGSRGRRTPAALMGPARPTCRPARKNRPPGGPMFQTYGTTHVPPAVREPERSLRFYEEIAGMQPVYRDADFVQVQTPGCRDILVFQRDLEKAGKSGGILHFGFRLTDPADIEEAARAVERAGGTIRSKGEFCPGEPYIFFLDPAG